MRAAWTAIAPPCWSLWKTGILVAAFRLFSTVKHFGAAMSSRTIPPKLVARRRQISTISSQFRVFRAMGMASTPAKVLKKTERTSSMARADSGPALPMP
ncbi:MAG: hypothetical protein XU12_C0004G0103 [Deltaproteobacteria bacterium CSP1-8]|nr:MAG: hypothetical protein XU12_C0004G0103 [Deltaproteobacteria bacterium CSP1-8]